MFRANAARVPGFAPICCDTNDPDTQAEGLKKRLLRDVPSPDPHELSELRQFVRTWLGNNLERAQVRLTFEEWLETTPYNLARKAELRLVFEGLKGGLPSRKQASRVQSFGKSESYSEYKNMRWINARPDVVKVWLGPLMKMVERELFSKHWFIKHTPVGDRPARLASLRNSLAKYFLTDFTAFESHFLPEIMEAMEFELYEFVLGGILPADEVRRIKDVLGGVNNLKTRLGVRARVRGRRMSGEMSTSLGNGFTNLMLALFLAHKKGVFLDGFVEGDDGIFSVMGGELTEDDYRRLGWTIKLAEVTDPCEMLPVHPSASIFGEYGTGTPGAFCGILCSSSGHIIRDPRSFLSTFGWSSSCIHSGNRVQDELLRAKALSAVYETPQCPIIGALSRWALLHTRHVRPRFVEDGYHQRPPDELPLPEFRPDMETRILFEKQFGVSPQNQIMIEARFSQGNFSVLDLIRPKADMLHYEARFVEAS
jgi:hypothetical protein